MMIGQTLLAHLKNVIAIMKSNKNVLKMVVTCYIEVFAKYRSCICKFISKDELNLANYTIKED